MRRFLPVVPTALPHHVSLASAIAIGTAKLHHFVTELRNGDIAVINGASNRLVTLVTFNEIVEMDGFPGLFLAGLVPLKGVLTVGTAHLHLESAAGRMLGVNSKRFSTVRTAWGLFGPGGPEVVPNDFFFLLPGVVAQLNQSFLHKRPRCSMMRTGTGRKVKTKMINPISAIIFRPLPSGENSVRVLG